MARAGVKQCSSLRGLLVLVAVLAAWYPAARAESIPEAVRRMDAMLQEIDRRLQALERAGAVEEKGAQDSKPVRARVAYEAAERVNTAAAFRSVFERFPDTFYADLARAQYDKLGAPGGEQGRTTGTTRGRQFRDCEELWCPELVVVASGSFMIGSPESEAGRDDDEGPVHRVTIAEPFAVGVYEVTIAQWDACRRGGGCSHNPDDAGWGRGTRPVMYVSWEDAQDYVEWLSRETGKRYRLLSESEWEYVARAGTDTRYWWGDELGRNRANCDGCGSRWDNRKTAPVGSFSANSFGLHDVHGNVWEWVEDCWHGDYAGAPGDGGARTGGRDCSARVLRGGSWFILPRFVRSAARDWFPSGLRNYDVGFRVARTLD